MSKKSTTITINPLSLSLIKVTNSKRKYLLLAAFLITVVVINTFETVIRTGSRGLVDNAAERQGKADVDEIVEGYKEVNGEDEQTVKTTLILSWKRL